MWPKGDLSKVAMHGWFGLLYYRWVDWQKTSSSVSLGQHLDIENGCLLTALGVSCSVLENSHLWCMGLLMVVSFFDRLLRLSEEELWRALTPLHGQNLMVSTTRHIFDGPGSSGSLMRTFRRHCLCLPWRLDPDFASSRFISGSTRLFHVPTKLLAFFWISEFLWPRKWFINLPTLQVCSAWRFTGGLSSALPASTSNSLPPMIQLGHHPSIQISVAVCPLIYKNTFCQRFFALSISIGFFL